MRTIIKRDQLLGRLIGAKHDGRVKIVTGIRRCGKSFLLFDLFRQHLAESGVRPDHVIAIDLEQAAAIDLRDPLKLLDHVKSAIVADGGWNYVLIDEIQRCRRVLAPGVDLARVHPDDRADAYNASEYLRPWRHLGALRVNALRLALHAPAPCLSPALRVYSWLLGRAPKKPLRPLRQFPLRSWR